MSVDQIEWVDTLPPKRRVIPDTSSDAQVALLLMSQPGKWARVKMYPKGKEASAHSYASAARHDKGVLRKELGFEVEARTLEDGGAYIYARYAPVRS